MANEANEPIQGEIVFDDQPVGAPPEIEPYRPRRTLPIILFVATCLSTFSAAGLLILPNLKFVIFLEKGLMFSVPLMLTLLAHEFGHYLQAVRYKVPASLPFFIPMPVSPIGTMGAVIAMEPGRGDRRALFDIAISGPLAGFVPAVIFSIVGLHWSEMFLVKNVNAGMFIGEPLFYKFLIYMIFGPLPEGHDIELHPVAFAGWVGIFITALNLIPIGQLDGGHILYALIGRRAHTVARTVVILAIVGVVIGGYWGWTLMLALILMMGVAHPPTQNDHVPLGRTRIVLGWLSLAFMPIGFTPMPFYVAG